MKVTDVITQYNGQDLMARIMSKYKNYPAGSISQREVVQGIDFSVHSREEAEQIVKALDATVSNAINDFQVKLLKK